MRVNFVLFGIISFIKQAFRQGDTYNYPTDFTQFSV